LTDLRAEVVNALHWNLVVPRYRVTAEVDGGVVTLHGIVERAYERSSAEATVRWLPGVMGVRNEIAIRPTQEVLEAAVHSLTGAGKPMSVSSQAQRFGEGS
jgi:hypothetical protein